MSTTLASARRAIPPTLLATIASGLAGAVTGAELPLTPGCERDYVRLLATPEYEAWLIAWAPAGGLDLHDHGGSAGAVHVARGRLAETFVDCRRSSALRVRTHDAGSAVAIPASRIHEMWNPGPGRAVSVHVYSPPLTTMTFFTRDAEGVLTPSYTQ